MEPGGHSSINSGFILTLGHTTMGGTNDPVADMQISVVTSVPLSAYVRAPTCLLPLRAIIFDVMGGSGSLRGMGVQPSKLQMIEGGDG